MISLLNDDRANQIPRASALGLDHAAIRYSPL